MSSKQIPVVEVFGPTVEGEGSISGMQTMFIRFGLCDFKCVKCDSKHAVDPQLVKLLAKRMAQEEIYLDMMEYMAKQKATHIQNITFSGGNPAIHDLTELVGMFHSAGKKVYVETQGTKCPDWLCSVDHVVVSPKAPGMGEAFDPKLFLAFMEKLSLFETTVTVKIVIFSAQDIEFAAGVSELLKHNNLLREGHFYLSLGNDAPPEFAVQDVDGDPENKIVVDIESTNKKTLVENLLSSYNLLCDEIMRDKRLAHARFLPQLHVLVYGNETGK